MRAVLALSLALLCAPTVAAASGPSLAAAYGQPLWRTTTPNVTAFLQEEPAPAETPAAPAPEAPAPVGPPVSSGALAAPGLDVSFEQDRFARGRRLHITSNIIIGVSAGLVVPLTVLLVTNPSTDTALLFIGGVVVASGGILGGTIGSNIGAINATSAASRALGRPAPVTAGIVGLVATGAGLLLAPIDDRTAGLGSLGIITGIVCGAVQFGQARRMGRDVGFVLDGVTPTRNGFAVVGRF